MERTNSLILNKAEAMKAFEYYLNNIQFKKPVKVSNIGEKDHLFNITIVEFDKEKI